MRTALSIVLASSLACAAQAGGCGPEWQTFASGFDKQVRTFGVAAGVLHAGGGFDEAHGQTAHSIAAWSGSQFDNLGGGLVWVFGSQFCNAIAGFGDGLAAGGSFIRAGNIPVQNFALWNEPVWAGLGGEEYFDLFVGVVESMIVVDEGGGDVLYIGGAGLHRWNGAAWEWAGIGATIEAIIAVDEADGLALYVARDHGPTASVDRRDPVTGVWTRLGTFDGEVRDIASWDDGSGPAIYACGDFQTVDEVAAKRIARLADGAWSALGSGLNNLAHSMAAWDDGSGERLWVGGQFSFAGGSAASRLASWDGSAWHGGGPSIDGPIYAIFPFEDGAGSSLWLGGNFTTIDGDASERIARIVACSLGGCLGDVNGDGEIGFEDLNLFLTSFNLPSGHPDYVPGADINGDGLVNFADLSILLDVYGEPC